MVKKAALSDSVPECDPAKMTGLAATNAKQLYKDWPIKKLH